MSYFFKGLFSRYLTVLHFSLGEYAAQVVAGVLSLKGALTVVATRARLMVQKCVLESTTMIAINLGQEKVTSILTSSADFSSSSIACYNSVVDCVVSGPIEQLKALKVYLDAHVKCKNVLLAVPFGYHSSAMQPILDDLVRVASRVTIRTPSIPIVSNVVGRVIPVGDVSIFTPNYYARHCAEPVLFDKGISDLLTSSKFQGNESISWIEIGPHPTTLPMLKVHPSVNESQLLLPSLRKKQDSWATISSCLAQLYVTSNQVQWRQTFSHISTQLVSVPSYPFSKGKFWVQYEDERPASVSIPDTAVDSAPRLADQFSMLHSWAQLPSDENGCTAIFDTHITSLSTFIVGHSVGGHPLCPASVYHELALAGAQASSSHLGYQFGDTYVVLRSIDYARPLVYKKGEDRVVKTFVRLDKNGKGSFEISSQVSHPIPTQSSTLLTSFLLFR